MLIITFSVINFLLLLTRLYINLYKGGNAKIITLFAIFISNLGAFIANFFLIEALITQFYKVNFENYNYLQNTSINVLAFK